MEPHTMPSQDRVGGAQSMPAQHLGKQPDQRGEYCPVSPVEARRGVGSAEHGDFVAHDKELGILGRRGPAQQHQPAEHLDEDQREQAQRHGTRSSTGTNEHRSPQVAEVGQLLEPHTPSSSPNPQVNGTREVVERYTLSPLSLF
jgi:hypothetical protein